MRAGQAVAWAVGRRDDDPVEALLLDEVVERVPVGAAARDPRIHLNSLRVGALLDRVQ